MSDNFEARIEKYFEGTSLGLAAVADVLEKMDSRFEKADQEEAAAIQKEQADAERTALIKDVATAVLEIQKANGQADNDLGLSTSDKSVGGTPSTANDKSAGDESETVGENNPTESASAPIQAEDEEEVSDIPVEDDEDEDEDPVAKMFKNLEKQLAALSLALGKGEDVEDEDSDESEEMEYPEDEEKSFDQSIAKSMGGVKDTLAKMGIRESASNAVQRVAVSPELSPSEAFISKSEDGETSVDLTKLSYKELRRLEDGIRSGAITDVEL